MFNPIIVDNMNETYKTLDEVINAYKLALNTLQSTINEVREYTTSIQRM